MRFSINIFHILNKENALTSLSTEKGFCLNFATSCSTSRMGTSCPKATNMTCCFRRQEKYLKNPAKRG